MFINSSSLTGLEEQDGYLTEIEVDEVLGFVGDIGTKVSAHDTMPSWVILFIEFLLDVCGNILSRQSEGALTCKQERGK